VPRGTILPLSPPGRNRSNRALVERVSASAELMWDLHQRRGALLVRRGTAPQM
jgi:hypothetical protein